MFIPQAPEKSPPTKRPREKAAFRADVWWLVSESHFSISYQNRIRFTNDNLAISPNSFLFN